MRNRPPPLAPPQTAADLPLAILERELAKRKALGDLISVPERTSFRSFIPGAWDVLERPRKFLPNWHVDAVADFVQAILDGEIRRGVINMPPSFGKSLISSVLAPAWDWGPNRRADRRWLCVSYGDDAKAPAYRDAERMRQLVCSSWYQAGWGTEFGLSDNQNAKDFYRNTKGGYRLSAGLGGDIPGQRADIVLIDDPTKPPEEAGDILSHVDLQRAQNVWESTMRSRAWDNDSAVLLVMHRLHEDDLTGYFLKQDGWVHLRLPALFETQERSRVILPGGTTFFEDPRTAEGEPLHAARTEAIADIRSRAIGQPWIHAAQDQQRPAPLEGGMVGHFEPWTSLPHLDVVAIVVDCAFKDAKDNSYVVMQAWGQREARAYLLDQVRDHLDMPKTCDALMAFVAKIRAQWPHAGGVYVEDKANGPGVVQMLKSKVAGLMTTTEDEEGPLCLKEFCKGSKESKLAAVSPYFAAGQVHIPDGPWRKAGVAGPEWTIEYVHELTTFPKSHFNDQVDATAMGVWKLLAQFGAHLATSDWHVTENQDNTSPVAGLFESVYPTATVPAAKDTYVGDFGFGDF